VYAQINHVRKLNFLCTFHGAFFTSTEEKSTRFGCAGAGFVPCDPGRVLPKLDVRLDRPTTLNSQSGTPLVFQTTHKLQKCQPAVYGH
jgi:hypothetical protein